MRQGEGLAQRAVVLRCAAGGDQRPCGAPEALLPPDVGGDAGTAGAACGWDSTWLTTAAGAAPALALALALPPPEADAMALAVWVVAGPNMGAAVALGWPCALLPAVQPHTSSTCRGVTNAVRPVSITPSAALHRSGK
jgi:hypothetical protein